MHAYLDPGSGSMVLGLVASGLAGIVVVLKTFGHRIMSVLMFWKKDDAAVAEPTEGTTEDGKDIEDADPASTVAP